MRVGIRKKVIGIIIAVVMVVLIFSVLLPPAMSVELGIGSVTPEEGNSYETQFTFNNVNITIRDVDRIPITSLKFTIYEDDDEDDEVHNVTFNVDGSKKAGSDPENKFTITIDPDCLSELEDYYTYGTLFDSDFSGDGSRWGSGYDYGYGYGDEAYGDVILCYTITYNATTTKTGTTDFNAILYMITDSYIEYSSNPMFFEIYIKSSGLKGPFNTAPVADSGGPYDGYTGEPTSFNGTESFDPDGDEITYSWDFGDGETGSGETPDHTYDAPGTYNVTLTVSDGALFSISKTTIRIGEFSTDDYDQDGTPDSEDDDDDNDGLDDETEEEIGSNPKNPDDVIKLEIGDNEYYLIDTDEDGEIDTIYNPQLGTYGPIEQEEDNIIIDVDGDGEVDYYYNQLSGQTTEYETETKEKEKLPLMLITGIIAAIVVILLIVIYLFRSGYLYFEKKQ